MTPELATCRAAVTEHAVFAHSTGDTPGAAGWRRSDSQRELGGERQRVAAEAAVGAGQRGGHHVLCSSTNDDEERVFGGF